MLGQNVYTFYTLGDLFLAIMVLANTLNGNVKVRKKKKFKL